MAFTKEDIKKINELVREINLILAEKFACNRIDVGKQGSHIVYIDIYERL